MKKNAKPISVFDFSTLYTTIPHKLDLKVLSEDISFVFKSKIRKRIDFSKTSNYYWTSKRAGRTYFTKQTLINANSSTNFSANSSANGNFCQRLLS